MEIGDRLPPSVGLQELGAVVDGAVDEGPLRVPILVGTRVDDLEHPVEIAVQQP